MSERQQFVVERESWLRGEGSRASALLRVDDGKQSEKPAAHDVEEIAIPLAARWLIGDAASLPANLYSTNDSTWIDDETRETRLTELFAVQGIDVRFE